MKPNALKQRVEARDRLVLQAESVESQLQDQVLTALARGDLPQARAGAVNNEKQLRELTQNLRIYQAELHAQADELVAAHERSEQMLTRFATLFAAMPVAALLVGFNGQLIEFNGKAQQVFGLRTRATVVRFLHRMVDDASYQDVVRPAFHEARDTGASMVDNVRFICEDGRRFIGEMHIARLPNSTADTGRDCEQFNCAVIDRTEHLQDLQALQSSAQALHQSEAFLAASARLARTGGWELQLQPRLLRCSKELHLLFGWAEDTSKVPTQIEDLLALCSPTDRGALARALAAAEQGQAFEIELEMIGANGRPVRMLAAAHAVCGEQVGALTEVECINGVFQDISQQAEARHKIEDLTERLDLANDAGGIGVFDWNVQTCELVFDERLLRLLGLPDQAQLLQADLAQALGQHVPAEEASVLEAAIARALQKREPLNVELRWQAPPTVVGAHAHEGAEKQWLHITGRAHFSPQGQPLRLVGCAWDSSAEHEAARLRAAKESAESASRAKSAFLSRMSHELRTPLNAILGFSQLMRMEAEGGDLVVKPHRVTLIETAARHLLELVNEVLDVSRIESGQVDVRLSNVDLGAVVAEVLSLLQGLAEKSAVSLHSAPGPQKEMLVLADRLRLKEVLINLVSNAIKYNRSGGRVDVCVERLPAGSAHGLVLSVSDTGRGLDKQQLAGMFQPFNRLGAEATGIEGTGMGLFVSHRFVELMGGGIDVLSQPGQGTTFRVRLATPS